MSRTFTIDTRLEEVAGLGQAVSAACTELGLDEDAAMDVELAVVEAATNVVCHGYGDKPGGSLKVELTEDGEALRIDVVDGGSPIPKGLLEAASIRYPADDLCSLPDSGRGLALIKVSVDDWRYEPGAGANRLTLIKKRQAR